jgi:hypothetical protein
MLCIPEGVPCVRYPESQKFQQVIRVGKIITKMALDVKNIPSMRLLNILDFLLVFEIFFHLGRFVVWESRSFLPSNWDTIRQSSLLTCEDIITLGKDFHPDHRLGDIIMQHIKDGQQRAEHHRTSLPKSMMSTLSFIAVS